MTERDLARGLAWFGIGLGMAQLLAPRRMGLAMGVGDRPGLMRLWGLREVVSGIVVLSQRQPAPSGLWLRLAGDVMDAAVLGAALRRGPWSGRAAASLALVSTVGALDLEGARRLMQAQTGEMEVHPLPEDDARLVGVQDVG